MVRVSIVFGEGLSSILTKIFTGSRAYHCFWQADDVIYDMHLLRRRRPASYYANSDIVSFDCPEMSVEYLERMLTEDNSEYGWKDYILFSLRGLFHLFGKSTVNANGVICSEMINNDLWARGVHTDFLPSREPPSPADLFEWFVRNRKRNYK